MRSIFRSKSLALISCELPCATRLSQKIGSANQYIEVPDVNKGRPALSLVAISGNDVVAELNRSAYLNDSKPGDESRLEAGPAVRRLRPVTISTMRLMSTAQK